jgi:hypothetical protein
MSEVLRFRQARAAQRKTLGSADLLVLYPNGPSDFLTALFEAPNTDTFALTFLTEYHLWSPVRRMNIGDLDAADAFLTGKGNKVSVEELVNAVGDNSIQDIAGFCKAFVANRAEARARLADTLCVSLLAPPYEESYGVIVAPELRDDLVRKLLIVGLFEYIGENPSKELTPEDVFALLRWRIIVLPPELLDIQRTPETEMSFVARQPPPNPPNRSRRRFVVRTGVSDLFVVRSEWIRYEAGEIAHIENVMAKETKERKHLRIDENEITATAETDTTTFNEIDSQTTDRFELNEDASRDTDLAVHADGQVNTSGQYGPTKVDTHIGGSLDFSQHDSWKRATTQSRETVGRTVTRVEQRVHNVRVARTLTRVEETNTHGFKNTTSAHISGVYRWVDKIQRFQIFRYPNRRLLEFQIPEPAAWWRWLKKSSATAGLRNEKPKPFTLNGNEESDANLRLKFSDVEPSNYAALGARYATLGLEPPPKPVLINEIFTQDTKNPRDVGAIKRDDPVRYLKLGEMNIPSGYAAHHAWWRPQGWHEQAWSETNRPSLVLSVGNNTHIYPFAVGEAFGLQYTEDSYGPLPLSTGGAVVAPFDQYPGVEQTVVKIGLRTDNIRGFSVAVSIECKPTVNTMTRWQISTYEKLASAYYAMKQARDEEENAAWVRTGVVIEGDSPERNTEVIREQLKLGVLSMLFGDATRGSELPFTWADLIDRTDGTHGPRPIAQPASVRAPMVQFLEQAFEWDKLTYLLYPYFWADKWTEIADIKSADAEFARFLRSGSARVVVSVRPGFESHIETFLDFGIIWGGGPPTAIGEEGYLSVANEIRSLHRAPDDGEAGVWWNERLPTTLVWLDGAPPLPKKAGASIQLGPADADATF